MNKCFFIGNVAKEPEFRTLSEGKEVCNLLLAVSEKWKDANGEKKELTEWVKVSIFNQGLVKLAKGWINKGSKIMVEGKMQTREWTDREGVKRYSTEIVLSAFNGSIELLGGKKDNAGQAAETTTQTIVEDDFAGEEIPF